MRVRLVGSIFVLSSVLAVGCGGGDDDDDVVDYDAAVTPQPDAAVPLPDATPTPDAAPTPDADTTDAAPMPDADTTDAGPMPDASPLPDGPVGCAPTGDYVEAADATNGAFASPEASGQTFDPTAPTAFSIGGCIDPAYETASVADGDLYTITLANDGMVRVEAENFGSPEVLVVQIYATDGSYIAGGAIPGTSGVAIHGLVLPADDYLIGVVQALPSPAAAYTYRVTVTQYPYGDCATLGGAADYTEANDGTGSRDNDMATVTYGPFTVTPTAATTDAPEPSGVTTAAGADYKLAGTTADVASLGDEYLDRDTFAFTTGPGVSELFIRLNWPDVDVDMDMLLFPMDGLDAVVAGATYVGTADDETIITGVDPDTTYWVWAGAYDDGPTMLPQDYSITICAH